MFFKEATRFCTVQKTPAPARLSRHLLVRRRTEWRFALFHRRRKAGFAVVPALHDVERDIIELDAGRRGIELDYQKIIEADPYYSLLP